MSLRKQAVSGMIWTFSQQFGTQVIFCVVAFFVNTHYTGKMLRYGALQQLADLLPTLLLAAFVGLIVYIAQRFLFDNLLDLPKLLLLSAIYTGLFLGAAVMLKFKEPKYLKELIKK